MPPRRPQPFARALLPAIVALAPAGAASAQAPAEPFVPEDAVQIEDSVKTCGIDAYTRFWEHSYRTKRLPAGQEFDLMLVGLFDPDTPSAHGPPLVWLYFGRGHRVREVFLTLPGKPVERLTNAELLRRWPHVCALIEDLHRRAEGGS